VGHISRGVVAVNHYHVFFSHTFPRFWVLDKLILFQRKHFFKGPPAVRLNWAFPAAAEFRQII
jgi:hypothetical protein